jgi:anti-anti-sigma regulatory factor
MKIKVRVTVHHPESEHLTLKIEGRIEGQPVQELHRAWQELAATLGESRLRVDLRGVTHIDGPGRLLLAEIHTKTRAEFIADTPLTK